MLLKDDLKKRSWLMLVSVLFFCLFFPGIVLDNVQGMISIYGEQGVESRFLNARTYSGNNYYAMAVFLLAAFCAFTGFSYIYSRQKLDFYHSLPVKRESWLVLKTVSSFLIFALPAGMAVLEELFMGVFYHVTDLRFVEAVLGNFSVSSGFSLFLLFMSASHADDGKTSDRYPSDTGAFGLYRSCELALPAFSEDFLYRVSGV